MKIEGRRRRRKTKMDGSGEKTKWHTATGTEREREEWVMGLSDLWSQVESVDSGVVKIITI